MWRAMWMDPDQLSSFRLDAAALARLWRFARPYRRRLLVYAAVTAGTGLVEILPALVIQRLIDRALPGRDLSELGVLVLALGGLYAATSGLHLAARWNGMHVGTG